MCERDLQVSFHKSAAEYRVYFAGKGLQRNRNDVNKGVLKLKRARVRLARGFFSQISRQTQSVFAKKRRAEQSYDTNKGVFSGGSVRVWCLHEVYFRKSAAAYRVYLRKETCTVM